MKQYVTYKRKKINDSFFADPNTNNLCYEQTQGQITFHETPYEVNGVFISWIEFDGRSINPEELEYFRTLDPDFDFQIVSEEQVNEYLKYYGKDNNNKYYVTVNNFDFTDNRPIEIY